MFEPENDLERSLLRAVNDPAQRPNFLLRMFNAQTFVALEIDGPPPTATPDGRVTVPPGAKLKLQMLREGHLEYLQFFTTLARARARSNGQSVFASMVSRELFERHVGRHFMLNPGHEHAQRFSTDDVSRMLAGQFGALVAPTAPVPTAPVPAAAPKPVSAVPPVEAKPVEANPFAAAPLPAANAVVADNPPRAEKPAATPAAATPPAAAAPLVLVQQPAAKPVEPKTPEPKTFVFKAPEPKALEPKAPVSKAPAPTAPAVSQPPASESQIVLNPPPAPRPAAPPLPVAQKFFSPDEPFVFDSGLAQMLESIKPIRAKQQSKTEPAAPEETRDTPSPVEAGETSKPEVIALEPVESEPIEPKPIESKPSASKKTGIIKTAMAEALAALGRLAAGTQASGKPDHADAAPAMPFASAEIAPVAKPAAPEAPPADQPPVPETMAAAQPEAFRPAPPVVAPAPPAPVKPVVAAPAPPAPVKPVEAPPRPPAAAKAVDAASSEPPAKHAEAIPPSASPKPVALPEPPPAPKPVAPPEPPPAPRKPRLVPPPGAQIGRPEPYPIDILLALTLAMQDMTAIEAAHVAQVQLAGHAPHHLVALATSADWEPLAQSLRLKLQKVLPPDRRIEFTPLADGMFEDYFRSETQPFFKRR